MMMNDGQGVTNQTPYMNGDLNLGARPNTAGEVPIASATGLKEAIAKSFAKKLNNPKKQ